MALNGEGYVRERRELAQHRGDLEGPAEAQPHARMGRQAGDVAGALLAADVVLGHDQQAGTRGGQAVV